MGVERLEIQWYDVGLITNKVNWQGHMGMVCIPVIYLSWCKSGCIAFTDKTQVIFICPALSQQACICTNISHVVSIYHYLSQVVFI
jgi:hypothetical protein